DVQNWGINFQRNLRRRNETSFWAPLPRQYNLFRLSLAGTLERVEIPDQRNLKIIPVVGGVRLSGKVGGFNVGFLQTANTGLFVVYNEQDSLETSGFGERERSFILKYSRLVDLLR
ncbi:MAG: hypothetical protein V3T72_00375, partial [Thermoanaerobaculia bacterium]